MSLWHLPSLIFDEIICFVLSYSWLVSYSCFLLRHLHSSLLWVTRVELFNGAGGVVESRIQSVDRSGADVMAVEDPKVIAPQGIQWHVYAAFGETFS